ncbi:MAG: SRPBCC family protein [Nocardioidaceae bacterium]
MSRTVVSARTTVAAPPEVVFAIVADARQHQRIDGSGTLRGTLSAPDRLLLGAEFRTDMRWVTPYRMTNKVVEFDEGRLIAWRHIGRHRWRYELEPVAGGTLVTETWDATAYSSAAHLFFGLFRFPQRNLRSIEGTLVRLKAAAEADADAGVSS